MKALVTGADENLRSLLDISLPTFEDFAQRHGYEVCVYEPEGHRPASWYKVPALLDVLSEADEALWLDADVFIADPSDDLEVEPDYWQAVAVHNTQDGAVPNFGVWLCRAQMRPELEAIWAMREYTHHPWWEQGAALARMGYDSWARPIRLIEPQPLYERTKFLGTEWNSHPWDEAENPRFLHATMRDDREAVMKEWASLATPT